MRYKKVTEKPDNKWSYFDLSETPNNTPVLKPMIDCMEIPKLVLKRQDAITLDD